MQTSSAEGNTSHGAKGSRTGYTPFSKQNNLEKVSETSSLTSEGSQAANPCPHGLCSCASLEQWSSLQLSQQHLLASNCNTSSEPATNSKCAGSQDMVVLVLPRTDQEAAAAGGTAADKPKPRMSGVSIAASTGQQSTSGVVTHWVHEVCHQSPKQLTQEFCLRLVALLLVVLATAGLAYRLAKKDN